DVGVGVALPHVHPGGGDGLPVGAHGEGGGVEGAGGQARVESVDLDGPGAGAGEEENLPRLAVGAVAVEEDGAALGVDGESGAAPLADGSGDGDGLLDFLSVGDAGVVEVLGCLFAAVEPGDVELARRGDGGPVA